MALLLVMAVTRTNPDPVKDVRGCYKRGDIVEVLDDAAHDGDLVANPIAAPFVLVRITGVTKAQIERLMQSQTALELVSGEMRQVVTRRRRYRVDVDDVPAGILDQLRDNRYVSVTWAQVRNYLRNKETNTTEGPTP